MVYSIPHREALANMGRLFELVHHGRGKADVLVGPSLDRAEAGPHTGEKYRVMRYRRLSYRYAMVVRPGRTWPLGEILQSDRLRLLVRSRWRPDTDTYETAARVEIIVDLAGVDEDVFEVQLFEDAVVLADDADEVLRHELAPAVAGVRPAA